MAALRGVHRPQQGQCTGHIIVPEAQRVLFTLADLDIGREMHHRMRLMLGESAMQVLCPANITVKQRAPLHRVLMSPREVIEHDRFVAARRQRLADVSADIAGASDNEDLHSASGFNRPSEALDN